MALDSPNPVWPYSSWETASHDLQNAAAAASDGDTVWVTNGVYDAGGDVAPYTDALVSRMVVERAVAVRSMNGPEETFIVGAEATGGGCGDGAVRGVFLADGALLEGFTIMNGHTRTSDGGYDQIGGGILMDEGGTVTNCIVSGNSANTEGGGIYCSMGGVLDDCQVVGNHANECGGGISLGMGGALLNSTVTSNSCGDFVEGGGVFDGEGGGVYIYKAGSVSNCTITANSADYMGGGVVFISGGTMDRCVISDNTVEEDGGGVSFSGNPSAGIGILKNSLVSGNLSGSNGGGVDFFGDGILYSCTIAGNTTAGEGGGVDAASHGVLTNCIVFGNSADGTENNISGSGTFSHTCSPGLSGDGNLNADPQFIDTAAGNYRLGYGSPCQNAGTNLAVLGSTDLDGNPRIADSRVDLGAYEYPAGLFVNMTNENAEVAGETDRIAIGGTSEGLVGSITWTNSAAGAGGSVAAGGTWQVADVPLVFGENSIAVSGTNVIGLMVYDSVFITRTLWHGGDSPVHYVAGSGLAVWPYTNWTTAAHTIQTAMTVAAGGDCVMVTNGVYDTGETTLPGHSLANRLVIDKPITVQGFNGPDHTFIVGAADSSATNGPGSVRGVYLTTHAVLSGFTVTNGHTWGELDDYLADEDIRGGGVFIAAGGTVSNCTILGSTAAEYGGGVVCWAGGSLNRCTIFGNSSYFGGGIYCEEDQSISACTILDNSADYGGGVWAGTLENCLLTGNSALFTAGGTDWSVLNNCTLSGNSAASGGGSGNSTLTNCIVFGNSASSGAETTGSTLAFCYTNDPHFVDAPAGDYHLQSASPCIDAGANGSTIDLDGTPRPLDGDASGTAIVDIGCYEFISDTADTDGDGSPDGDEQIADTDSTDSNDWFRVTSISNGIVYFDSSNARWYTLLGCTNLVSNDWKPLPGSRMGIGGSDFLTSTNNLPVEFYKLEVEIP